MIFLLKTKKGKELTTANNIIVMANGTVAFNTIFKCGEKVYLITYEGMEDMMLILEGTTSMVSNPMAFYVQKSIEVDTDIITR